MHILFGARTNQYALFVACAMLNVPCCWCDVSCLAECGTLKICARKREIEHTEARPTRIRTALELKEFAEGKPEDVRGLIWPTRTLKQKRGRGIFRRYFHYVPAAGEGAVSRRISRGSTVEGSSRLHVFADIGVAGHLKTRERGCHQEKCPCWDGKYAECKQIPRDPVLGLAQASHPLLCHNRKIKEDAAAEASVSLTRNALANEGIRLSHELKEGEVVAFFVDDLSEPWMIGKVMKTRYQITDDDAVYTWMGQMEAGDWVTLVHKYDPITGGMASAYFKLKDGSNSVFPCWVEDLRAANIQLEPANGRRAPVRGVRVGAVGSPLDERWKLPVGERERVQNKLPLAYGDTSIDRHKDKRRKAEFAKDDDDDSSGDESGGDGPIP